MPKRSGTGTRAGAGQLVIPLSAPSIVSPSMVTSFTPSTTMMVASGLPVVRLVVLATIADGFTTEPLSPRRVSDLAIVSCSGYVPGQITITSRGRAAATALAIVV